MTKPTTYSVDHELTYREPTAAEVALTSDLAKTIKAFGKTMRESLFHICLIAYGIRRRNLRKIRKGERGGNQQGQKYKEEFTKWYEDNDLKSVYGTLSSFTKYAMAGRLLTFTRWQINRHNGFDYIDRLPHHLSALYELQKIIWESGDTATDEGRQRYKDLMIQPIDDGTTDNTWINRSLTAKEVIEKRAELDNEPAPKSLERKIDDPRNIPVLRIKTHEGLYDFNRRGNKRRVKGPDIDEVRCLVDAINDVISDFGSEYFSIETNMEHIEEKYEQKKNPNFAKFIE